MKKYFMKKYNVLSFSLSMLLSCFLLMTSIVIPALAQTTIQLGLYGGQVTGDFPLNSYNTNNYT